MHTIHVSKPILYTYPAIKKAFKKHLRFAHLPNWYGFHSCSFRILYFFALSENHFLGANELLQRHPGCPFSYNISSANTYSSWSTSLQGTYFLYVFFSLLLGTGPMKHLAWVHHKNIELTQILLVGYVCNVQYHNLVQTLFDKAFLYTNISTYLAVCLAVKR